LPLTLPHGNSIGASEFPHNGVFTVEASDYQLFIWLPVVVEYKIAGMSLSLKINNNIGEVSVELMPKPMLGIDVKCSLLECKISLLYTHAHDRYATKRGMGRWRRTSYRILSYLPQTKN
jgi:hypothetical protein